MSLPDFGLEEHATWSVGAAPSAFPPSLLRMFDSEGCNDENKSLQQMKGNSSALSNTDFALFEDASTRAKLSNTITKAIQECTEASDIVWRLARFWVQNETKFLKENIVPREVYSKIIYGGNMHGNVKKKWGSMMMLQCYFMSKPNANSLRNKLVIKGMLRYEAERYIRWQSSLTTMFEFDDIPLRVLGNCPRFTDEIDRELLLFVSEQNGLCQNRNFIDWNAEKVDMLKPFHGEMLAMRFKDQYEYRESKQRQILSDSTVDAQKRIHHENNVNKYKIYKYQVPIPDVVMEIDKEIDANTNPRDTLIWIRASKKIGWESSTCLLRFILKQFWVTGNVKRNHRYLKLCFEDDALSREICDRDSKVSKQIEKLAIAIVEDRTFKPNLDTSMSMGAMASLKKVVPYLLGKNAYAKNWDCMDLLIYESLKGWEERTKHCFVAYDSFMTRVLPHAKAKAKIASKHDIEQILFGDDDPQHMALDDVYEPINRLPGNASRFWNKFCWRKFSTEEWKRIIDVICKWNYIIQDLKSVDVWKEILHYAQIQHQRSLQEIRDEFFCNIKPSLCNYGSVDNMLYIENILIGDTDIEIGEKYSEVAHVMPQAESSTPSSWSAKDKVLFSTEQWKQILDTICRKNILRHELFKDGAWEELLKHCAINPMKTFAEVRDEFFSKIEPSIGAYLDEQIKDDFLDVWKADSDTSNQKQ